MLLDYSNVLHNNSSMYLFSPCCPIHPVCQFQIFFFFPANCCWFFIFCLSLSHSIRWSCGWSFSFYPPVKSSGWCYLRAAWRCFSLPDSYCQHEFNQVLFESCLFLVTLFLHLKLVCLIPPEGFYWHYQPTSVLLRKGKYLPVTHLSAHSLLLTLCLPANNSSEFQSMSKVSDSSLKHCKIISYSFWPFYPLLSGRAPSRFPSERPLCWATCPLSVNSPFLFNKNCKPASDLLSLFFLAHFDTTNMCYFFHFYLFLCLLC